jgi:hypothetical protein
MLPFARNILIRHGFAKKTPQGKNLKAQAPQAHASESSQEAFAL